MASETALNKLGILGTGILANQALVWGFDYVLYPAVLLAYGALWGSLIMTYMSLVVCLITMIFYDWSRQDWLGIETIKEWTGNEGKGRAGKILKWLHSKGGDTLVFLALTIKFDPFITTAYMRKGVREYNGLCRRDWKIFFTSLIIGNLYWTILALTGLTVAQWVWEFILRAAS